jgi:hypothetical protein
VDDVADLEGRFFENRRHHHGRRVTRAIEMGNVLNQPRRHVVRGQDVVHDSGADRGPWHAVVRS